VPNVNFTGFEADIEYFKAKICFALGVDRKCLDIPPLLPTSPGDSEAVEFEKSRNLLQDTIYRLCQEKGYEYKYVQLAVKRLRLLEEALYHARLLQK
jgi:hypothetical protein